MSLGGDGVAAGRGTIATVHRYELPLSRELVWSRIAEVGSYRGWWPWLRVFDGAGLSVGDEWRCTVQPPVPYLVRFRVIIDHVEEPSLVRARVMGDVVGDATLTLETVENGNGNAAGSVGCVAVLDSRLAPGNAALRVVSRVAAPIARFGHDWVLDSAARQFIARAVQPVLGDSTPRA